MNNRERKEHAKSMKEFDRDYRKTKEGVWKQTRQYQTGSRKKVVIGLAGFFLIVFCIFMAELQAGALEKSLGKRETTMIQLSVRFRSIWIRANMENYSSMENTIT